MTATDLEVNTFQKNPAYRYIRQTDNLPGVLAGHKEDPPMARIKIFDPTGSWTWYIQSYDPETRIAFGLVDGFCVEYNSFSMKELCAVRGSFGLPLERDIHFKPCDIRELEPRLQEKKS